jgi:triosephosphate isomerase (TIM)
MRVKLVVGNWKMHGSLAANQALLQALIPAVAALKSVEVAVCPPYPYLVQAGALLGGKPIAYGAQNVSPYENGAYTGEVSAAMLAECRCRYVIVGHSERRSLFGESSELVAEKFQAVIEGGMVPILCVGETLTERESGRTEAVVAAQLDAVVSRCSAGSLRESVLAYEPVWAIGTGKTATPVQAQAVHEFLRRRIAAQDAAVAQGLKILYGGSVKAANAAELFSQPDIDGGLIGGASLQAAEFAAICQAADAASR